MEEESYARQLYGRWDTFSRTSFERVVDEVLSRFDSLDETIEIELLSLDLGVITEDDFDEKFPKLLAEKLNDTFSVLLRNPENYSQQIRIIPMAKSRIELLACYLQHGYFPWYADSGTQELETLLREAMQMDADGLRLLIRSLGENEKVRTRLIWQLSDKMLESIVVLIEPGESGFINTYTHVLVSLYPYTGHPEISRQNFRDVVHSLVFAYLLYPNRGYFMRKQFVWQTIYGLSQRYNIPVLSLIDLLTRQVQTLSEGKTLLPGLFLILNELRAEMRLGGELPDTMKSIAERKESDNRMSQTEVSGSNCDASLIPIINQQSNNLKDTEMDNLNERDSKVENAGLVLLAPFLPILFSRLGYLAVDRREFVSKEMQIRGLFLMQYLITQQSEAHESDLVLNKILVNYLLFDPLPREVELTNDERDMAGRLLESAKSNWRQLKNTSDNGFRDTFLKRQAMLKEEPDNWTLTVEEKPYDILLDSLPWSYALVKLPFQAKLIRVNWR